MTTPQALHHSLLRPCILQILRAAGYHSTRPSVLDTLTDLAARYMFLLAQTTATHASVNHNEPELSLEISIQDVRMAMQDCGALIPERVLEEQEFDGEEDTRGVDAFVAWAMGKVNQEIRRVALEGSDGAKEDYLTGSSSAAPKSAFLTPFSPQEKAQYDRRRNEICWNRAGQACRTEDHQSRGERGHQSKGMGREAEEPNQSRIYTAIVPTPVFGFELSGGRDGGRNGILELVVVLRDALRRRWDLVCTIQDLRIPRRNRFYGTQSFSFFSLTFQTDLIPSFSTLFPAPPSTLAPCLLAA
jgi:hypothetical protein